MIGPPDFDLHPNNLGFGLYLHLSDSLNITYYLSLTFIISQDPSSKWNLPMSILMTIRKTWKRIKGKIKSYKSIVFFPFFHQFNFFILFKIEE